MRALILGLLLLTATATACGVTRLPTIAERPRWRIAVGGDYEARCLAARAFVRKSGKQGLGVAIQLRSRGDCAVAFTGAKLVLGGRDLPLAPAWAPMAMHGHSQAYAWLPVHFDNNAAWNDGVTTARLVLAVTLDGTPAADWELDLADEMHVAGTP